MSKVHKNCKPRRHGQLTIRILNFKPATSYENSITAITTSQMNDIFPCCTITYVWASVTQCCCFLITDQPERWNFHPFSPFSNSLYCCHLLRDVVHSHSSRSFAKSTSACICMRKFMCLCVCFAHQISALLMESHELVMPHLISLLASVVRKNGFDYKPPSEIPRKLKGVGTTFGKNSH